MKIVKGLTAFILLPAFMFGGGFAVGTIAMDYFYPGRNFTTEDLMRQVRFDQRIDEDWLKADWPVSVQASDLTRAGIGEPEEPGMQNTQGGLNEDMQTDTAAAETSLVDNSVGDAVLVSLLGGSSINADTIYVIQEYSRSTRTLTEEIIPVPENFIGMDHAIFSQVMADFDRYPTLSEMQKGMISCEVISFSPSRVVIRKTYDDATEEMKPGYYLINDNGLVTVYLSDLKTVFMNTSIEFHSLPAVLQEEIMFSKYVEGQEELFGFLEAYSS
ncbi:MAG: hypothetical protein FWE14_09855 [Lachnospiraceae bacterium]|nr:hypothetical protein [Lachnospiraceae bacterium]